MSITRGAERDDETVTTTTSVLGQYSEGSQSIETSRPVDACQQRSNRPRQRVGSQFAERKYPHRRKDFWETAKR